MFPKPDNLPLLCSAATQKNNKDESCKKKWSHYPIALQIIHTIHKTEHFHWFMINNLSSSRHYLSRVCWCESGMTVVMDNNAFNKVKAFQTPFLYYGPFAKACSQLMGQTVQAALQQLIIISSKYPSIHLYHYHSPNGRTVNDCDKWMDGWR